MEISISGLRHIVGMRAAAIPPDAPMMAQAGIPVPVVPDAIQIRFFGESSLSSSQKESGAETVLSFSSLERIPPFIEAFIVEDNNGRRFIVGSADHPFPTIESSFSSGESVAGSSGFSYKISFKGPVIPCLAWLPSDSMNPQF